MILHEATIVSATRPHRCSSGGTTLLVLVILVALMLILSAALQYVGRQAHDISRRQADVQAWHVAAMGVERGLWLLDPSGGGKDAADVAGGSSTTPLETTIINTTVAAFSALNFVEFTAYDPGGQTVELQSYGVAINRPTVCQQVQARVHQFAVGYGVIQWEAGAGQNCPLLERGCFTYQIIAAGVTTPFSRIVHGVLSGDDCATFAPRANVPLDVYRVAASPGDTLLLKVEGANTNFTPIVEVWGATTQISCSTINDPNYNRSCVISSDLITGDHVLVSVSAAVNSIAPGGEYTLAVQYN